MNHCIVYVSVVSHSLPTLHYKIICCIIIIINHYNNRLCYSISMQTHSPLIVVCKANIIRNFCPSVTKISSYVEQCVCVHVCICV